MPLAAPDTTVKPLVEAGTFPARMFTIPELAAARKAGFLTIHDNGVLTVQYPGQPPVEVQAPMRDRRRESPSVDIPQ